MSQTPIESLKIYVSHLLRNHLSLSCTAFLAPPSRIIFGGLNTASSKPPNCLYLTLISTIKYTFIIFISRCIPTFILTTTFIRIRSLITNICILLRIPILIPIYIRIRVCLGLLLPQSTFPPHQLVFDPFYSY